MSDSMTMTPPAPVDGHTPDVSETVPAPAESGASKKRASSKPARVRKGLSPADVRAVLRKHDELSEATEEQRAMLADALGKPGADIAQLTEIVLTSTRIDLGAIGDLSEIAEKQGAMKRAIAAMQLTSDRARTKAVWNLLVSLGVITGNLPGNDGDTAEGIATAIDSITSAHAEQLDTVRLLAAR